MKKIIIILTLVVVGDITACYIPPNLPDLGNGYKFDKFKNTLQVENSKNTVVVGSRILEYAYDSTFIILTQRPIDSVPGIETMNYHDYWEAFKNSSFKQYWIINKREANHYILDQAGKLRSFSNVYGPFKKQEYLEKREKFEVPKTLRLKKIDFEK